jgi:hypothetical protein
MPSGLASEKIGVRDADGQAREIGVPVQAGGVKLVSAIWHDIAVDDKAGRPARVVWEVRFAGDRREYWDPAAKQVMDYVTHSRTQRGKPLSAGR